MKKIFSILAAALAIFTANAQSDNQDVTYMEYAYVAETNSVDTSFPNADSVSYNAMSTVTIQKDKKNFTTGVVTRVEGKLNAFTLAMKDQLVPGTYTIAVKAGAFTCFAGDKSADNVKSTMTWTIQESGIKSISMDNEDAEIYNLSGRKVKELVPGVMYIKNGTKFIAR